MEPLITFTNTHHWITDNHNFAFWQEIRKVQNNMAMLPRDNRGNFLKIVGLVKGLWDEDVDSKAFKGQRCTLSVEPYYNPFDSIGTAVLINGYCFGRLATKTTIPVNLMTGDFLQF